MFKKFLVGVLTVSMLLNMVPAQAKFGGSHSSYHSSSHSSTSSHSTSSYHSSPSKSFSGGGNVGMQRSTVTNNVRNGNATNQAYRQPSHQSYSGQTTQTNNYYRNYNTNSGGYYQGNTGHSTGALVGAAVAGGLVGYMLHRDNHGNTYYTNPNNPNVAYGSNGQVLNSIPNGDYQTSGIVGDNNQYSVIQPVHQSSSWFGWFLFLTLIIVGYFIYRYFRSLSYTTTNNGLPSSSFEPIFNQTKTKIINDKEQLFMNFQQYNRPSKIDYIRENTDEFLFNAIKDNVLSSNDNRTVVVKNLEAELVDFSKEGSFEIASVHYTGEVLDDNELSNINEIWNFKYLNNTWKLVGISQV